MWLILWSSLFLLHRLISWCFDGLPFLLLNSCFLRSYCVSCFSLLILFAASFGSLFIALFFLVSSIFFEDIILLGPKRMIMHIWNSYFVRGILVSESWDGSKWDQSGIKMRKSVISKWRHLYRCLLFFFHFRRPHTVSYRACNATWDLGYFDYIYMQCTSVYCNSFYKPLHLIKV